MARPNYSGEKRRKELEKQKKKAEKEQEKKQRKLDQAAGIVRNDETPADDADEAGDSPSS
ncbi:MAG: hypothetical protein ABR526_10140 [Chthoniobacterales bacterium]